MKSTKYSTKISIKVVHQDQNKSIFKYEYFAFQFCIQYHIILFVYNDRS